MRRSQILFAILLAAGAPRAALAQDGAGRAQPTQPQAEQPENPPQHSPDAVAALQAAAEAVKNGFAADFRTYAEGNPLLASTFPKGDGRWVQKPLGENGEWMVRYTGSGNVMTRNEPVDFDILWDPEKVTWVDHITQTYNADRLTGRKSGEAYMLASSAWSQVEDLSRGFPGAMKAAVLEMREPSEIDGVPCDVVAITARTDGDSVLWHFGREDHLPRRSEIILPMSDMEGAIRADFTNVAAGPDAVADASWEIPVPEGYEQKIARALQPRTETPAAPDNARLPPPQGLPEWEVPDSEGTLVSPGALRGKVALLYFWGTWSPECRKPVPNLQALAADYAGKPVELISMAFREGTPEGVLAAAREQGQTWRQVPQADEVVRMLSLRVAPSFVLLGPEGELLFRSGRPRGGDYDTMFKDMRVMIDRALAGETDPQDKTGDEPAPKGPGAQVSPAGATPAKPGKFKVKD